MIGIISFRIPLQKIRVHNIPTTAMYYELHPGPINPRYLLTHMYTIIANFNLLGRGSLMNDNSTT